ncbi:hypothetical protein M427DRAFT_64831, partial [Gonapodya prolifera JEL478]
HHSSPPRSFSTPSTAPASPPDTPDNPVPLRSNSLLFSLSRLSALTIADRCAIATPTISARASRGAPPSPPCAACINALRSISAAAR